MIIHFGTAPWLLRLFFFEIFSGDCQHQLNTVLLIDAAGTGIVVNRYDIACRIKLFNLTDHALTDNMIRQATERLSTDDIFKTGSI